MRDDSKYTLTPLPGSPSRLYHGRARPFFTLPTFAPSVPPLSRPLSLFPPFSLCFSPSFDTSPSPTRPAAFHVDGESLSFFFLRQAFDRGRQPVCVCVCESTPVRWVWMLHCCALTSFFSSHLSIGRPSFRPCDSPVEPRSIITDRCRRHRKTHRRGFRLATIANSTDGHWRSRARYPTATPFVAGMVKLTNWLLPHRRYYIRTREVSSRQLTSVAVIAANERARTPHVSFTIMSTIIVTDANSFQFKYPLLVRCERKLQVIIEDHRCAMDERTWWYLPRDVCASAQKDVRYFISPDNRSAKNRDVREFRGQTRVFSFRQAIETLRRIRHKLTNLRSCL